MWVLFDGGCVVRCLLGAPLLRSDGALIGSSVVRPLLVCSDAPPLPTKCYDRNLDRVRSHNQSSFLFSSIPSLLPRCARRQHFSCSNRSLHFTWPLTPRLALISPHALIIAITVLPLTDRPANAYRRHSLSPVSTNQNQLYHCTECPASGHPTANHHHPTRHSLSVDEAWPFHCFPVVLSSCAVLWVVTG